MLRRYRAILKRRIPIIAGTVFAILFALWTLSLWIPSVADWLNEQNVFGLIIVGLLAEVLASLDGLSNPRVGIQAAVGNDQNEDLTDLRRFVHERRPATADLLEYSSFMVNSLLEDLTHQDTTIRLLICDPATAINPWQTKRIESCIATLCDVTLRDYQHATVRCYQIPSTVRGRKIDNYLHVGWYFYGHDHWGVQGTNTMLTADVDSYDGHLLQILFDESFELLWNHERTWELDLATGVRRP